MKKQLIIAVLLCLLTGCVAAPEAGSARMATTQPANCTVGICLPDESDPYWATCGSLLNKELESLGYIPELYYAQNDVLLQAQQVVQLQTQGVSCLVVAGIDSVGLTDALAQVYDAGIPVIALDRMLMDTDGVRLCVSFDYKAIGEAMGRHIERELALDTAQQEGRSHRVEFFMGSPDDPNAPILHQGILSVLQSYLGSGVLTCPSGRTAFEDVWILREAGGKAGETLLKYIDQYYTEKAPFPQIICTGSDALAQGCIQALEQRKCSATQWPLIVGQGNTPDNVTAKKQAMTVQKDLTQLAADCADAVGILIADGQLPEGFAQATVNNHAISVPVRLCDFEVVVSTQEQDGETGEILQEQTDPTEQ